MLQRTRGVRMAIGARRGEVVKMIVRQGVGWVLTGGVLGLAGAVGLTYAIRSMVYGLENLDPWSLAWATLAVASAAMLACWLPARRAAGVDPVIALRTDWPAPLRLG